jgi:hypothetical protein
VAIVFIELPLPLVHAANILVCIMANIERSDNAVIGSWPSLCGQTLPDQKNLLGEALDIVTIFHHRDPSDVPQQGRLG